MEVMIESATDAEFTLIRNLVPYYVYDIAEYMAWDCDADGRWDGCTELPDYWERADHHPYVIRAEGRVAGFILIRPYPSDPGTYEISDFFVARTFKGHGVGRQSAFQALDSRPGKWLVRVLNGNTGAREFWGSVLDAYTGGDVVQTEERYEDPYSGAWDMQYYRFVSRRSI